MTSTESVPPPGGESTGWLVGIVRRPVAVTMVVLAVSVFGVVSLTKLPVDLLPEISYPTLTVRTAYDGAAPIDVEKLVTKRIEERLSVISGLVSTSSISRAGVSDVILEFEWNTPMTFAAQDVREQVDQVQALLPDDVERPLILRYDPTLDPILRLAVFAPAETATVDSAHLYELRRVAEDEIQRRLENIPGVAAVRVRGGFEEEWRIELDDDLLKVHGISADQVKTRVAEENVNVAGGILRDGDRENLVRTMGEITRIRELAELVVMVKDGQPIRVADVSRVRPTNRERDIITRVESVESVEVEVYKEATANIVDVAHRVKSRLYGPKWRERLVAGEFSPETAPTTARRGDEKTSALMNRDERPLAAVLLESGIRTRVLSDQSVFIEQSLEEVRDAGLIGGLLAIVVLFFFLRRLAPTLIIGITIPISVVATFAPLYLTGVSLNVMSLGGLALGIGMLVDSAIVVLEAIARRREEGEDVVTSAIRGTKEVGLPVFASTLTTVAVFLPIVFVEGIAGEFFRDQALSVVFSLVASLVAAIFFIPMLASRRLGGTRPRLSAARVERWMPWRFARYFSIRNLTRDGPLWRRIAMLPFEAIRFLAELLGRMVLAVALGVAFLLRWTVRLCRWILHWVLYVPLLIFDATYRASEAALVRILRAALRARAIVLLAAFLLGYWAYTRVTHLGIELIPRVHQGEFTVETQLLVGTPIQRTDATGLAIEATVRQALEAASLPIASLSSSAGVARDVLADPGDGAHTSRLNVRLAAANDFEEQEERAFAHIRKALAGMPGVSEPVFERPSLFSTKTAIEVQVVGADLSSLGRVAQRVEQCLTRISGLTDIQSTHRAGHPELVIIPDRERLAFYDLGVSTVANLVRDKVQGTVTTRVTRGDRKVDVLIRVPEADVDERTEILGLQVTPPGRPPIPLSSVAHIEERPGPAEIRHLAGKRAIVIEAQVLDLDLAGAAVEIDAKVRELEREDPDLFRGVAVSIGGQTAESEKSMTSLVMALLVATFLVYIVMAAQFESLIHPLVILCSVPLAFVGVVPTLEFLGIQLSVVVLIGAIMLVGIVVNNAIVLVDSINSHRRQGLDRDSAIVAAARRRLRPILMTTATTVLGLLPLSLGLGEGTEIRTPMAVTVIAGLTSSTLLTLVVVPVIYSMVSASRSSNSDSEEA